MNNFFISPKGSVQKLFRKSLTFLVIFSFLITPITQIYAEDVVPIDTQVQSQCTTCSAQQGAYLSNISKQIKSYLSEKK